MKTCTDITIDTNVIHSTFPSLDIAEQWLRNHGYHMLVMYALDHVPDGSWVTKEYQFKHGEDIAILNYYVPKALNVVDEQQLELTFDA